MCVVKSTLEATVEQQQPVLYFPRIRKNNEKPPFMNQQHPLGLDREHVLPAAVSPPPPLLSVPPPVIVGRVALCGDTSVGKTTLFRRMRERLQNSAPSAVDLRARLTTTAGEETRTPRGEGDNDTAVSSFCYAAFPPSRSTEPHDPDAGQQGCIAIQVRELGDCLRGSAAVMTMSSRAYTNDHLEALFRDTTILVVMFDLSRRQTFAACDDWIRMWSEHRSRVPGENSHGKYTGLLIGTKKDIQPHLVYDAEILDYARKRGMSYTEIQANGAYDDIDLVILYLARMALHAHQQALRRALIGAQVCPPGCTIDRRRVPHCHVLDPYSLEDVVEFLTLENAIHQASQEARSMTAVAVVAEQPPPALQRRWLRVGGLSQSAQEILSTAANQPVVPPLLANRWPRDEKEREQLFPRRVPTNILTRPQKEPFNERTSLLTDFSVARKLCLSNDDTSSSSSSGFRCVLL